MDVKNAVAACLAQYTSIEGRASRTEFWYFVLVVFVLNLVVFLVSWLFLPPNVGPVIQAMVMLALTIPLFSVFVRRLHDLGYGTWRIAFFFIPVVQLVCLYWAARPGQKGENKFGEEPVE